MSIEVGRKAGVGQSVPRIDGVPKVRGEFEYASDLHRDGMLFGATVRSPHASARITGIDVAAAAQMPGVHAVMTHADVPGKKTFGLDVQDQPVLASEVVRYAGEAVAIVAAESAEVARQAANAITVQYEPLPPVT
ncbi:MAG: xanthine dehydrogenase subunit D, partial [Chloroflexi bacterium]